MGTLVTIFSTMQNWPCWVLLFIFQTESKRSHCCDNGTRPAHAALREGANARGKHPTPLEAGSLGDLLPPKLHKRVNLEPTPHAAASEPLLQGAGIFPKRNTGRRCRKVHTGPGLPGLQRPEALRPQAPPREAPRPPPLGRTTHGRGQQAAPSLHREQRAGFQVSTRWT